MYIFSFNYYFYRIFIKFNLFFLAGANYDESLQKYQPDITSYDYDAPLNEAGDPTLKYYAIRDVLVQVNQNHFVRYVCRLPSEFIFIVFIRVAYKCNKYAHTVL